MLIKLIITRVHTVRLNITAIKPNDIKKCGWVALYTTLKHIILLGIRTIWSI